MGTNLSAASGEDLLGLRLEPRKHPSSSTKRFVPRRGADHGYRDLVDRGLNNSLFGTHHRRGVINTRRSESARTESSSPSGVSPRPILQVAYATRGAQFSLCAPHQLSFKRIPIVNSILLVHATGAEHRSRVTLPLARSLAWVRGSSRSQLLNHHFIPDTPPPKEKRWAMGTPITQRFSNSSDEIAVTGSLGIQRHSRHDLRHGRGSAGKR